MIFVAPTTPGSEAGLQAGDVIESIDGKPVVSTTSFRFVSTARKKHDLQVVRKKQKLVVTLNNDDGDENK
ncbi:MAG: hypothetical protein C5B55_12880 [Blastocatellia bacterium]|nr:MAG: hypothetical protein C5B55_12880 [Blastocatellia bacterium]